MLRFLRIKNLAIVSELEIEFNSGLNVITGETGSGKSLILKGLELLRGGRSSSDLIRAGAQKGEVEALFILEPEIRARTISDLQEHYHWVEEVFAEDEIVLKRVIDGTGRGKITINSRLSTRTELETISSALFDITGQHSQQRLLDPRFHLQCLDQFGVNKEILAEVKKLYSIWNEFRKKLERARVETSSNQELLRRLKFEVEELSEAKLKADEKELLELQVKRASSVESLSLGVSEILAQFDGENDSIESTLEKISSSIAKLKRIDPGLETADSLADSLIVQTKELRSELEHYISKLEIDPEELESFRTRLSILSKLERKYSKGIAELVEYLASISRELSLHESGAYDIEKLAKEEREAREALLVVEQKLTKSRLSASGKLSKDIERRLELLEMKKAKFSVNLEPTKSTEEGADKAQFMLTANPGEPSKSLNEVASGGELSRVLLVLKTLLSEQTIPVLQVFDEIDVGVGGATAHVIGEQLKALSKRFQVLAVTHAPQVAALADTHLVVSKELAKSRTEVSLKTLSKEDRVIEVARMLAGREVGDQFLKSAESLING